MKKLFNELYNADMERYKKTVGGGIKRILTRDYIRKYHYYLRKTQTTENNLLKKYYDLRYRRLCTSHHLEIPSSVRVGKGLYLGHPFCITINSEAIIGENCNIHKNVTIGQENRGIREGTPIIGNQVWIGINATIVGRIRIGDDVLIAPNSYVNCNVPNHSIVFGNPCIIRSKEKATENYINSIGGLE